MEMIVIGIILILYASKKLNKGLVRRMLPMGKNIFLTRLREAMPIVRERYGVQRIGIFGSAGRGEERPDSDIDILVEFAPGKATFRNFMELAFFLEDLFGRKVDLVTEQGLSRYIRPYVTREVVWCET